MSLASPSDSLPAFAGDEYDEYIDAFNDDEMMEELEENPKPATTPQKVVAPPPPTTTKQQPPVTKPPTEVKKSVAVVPPPAKKAPVRFDFSSLTSRSLNAVSINAATVAEKTAIPGETDGGDVGDEIEEEVLSVIELSKGPMKGADLSTVPKYIIILIDNSERALGYGRNGRAARRKFIQNITNTIEGKRKEKAKKDPSDTRYSRIFVCQREEWHNHKVTLGLPGMFPEARGQLMKVEGRDKFSGDIVMKALKASGIVSASFDCSDMIFLDELGKARSFAEHKTFPDARNSSFGNRKQEYEVQQKKLHELAELFEVPVEIVVSGQSCINTPELAKGLVNKVRTSDLPWFFTFDTEALPYWIMHTALHLLDPKERYNRAHFLKPEVMSRVHNVSEVDPLDHLKANFLVIKGVSVEIATAFINHGITSVAQLVDYGRKNGKQAFMDLKTKGNDQTEGRRIGIQGGKIFKALGLEEEQGEIPEGPQIVTPKKSKPKSPRTPKRRPGAHTSDEEERYTGPIVHTGFEKEDSPGTSRKRHLQAPYKPAKKSKVSASNFKAKETIEFTPSGSDTEPNAGVDQGKKEDDDKTTDGEHTTDEENVTASKTKLKTFAAAPKSKGNTVVKTKKTFITVSKDEDDDF